MDFQQLRIIQEFVRNNNIPVNVIGCQTIREEDGLALSSRNTKLSKYYREIAGKVYEIINYVRINFDSMSFLEIYTYVDKFFDNIPEIELEYFTIAESKLLQPAKEKIKNKQYRVFIAVKLNGIRLIDNMALN